MDIYLITLSGHLSVHCEGFGLPKEAAGLYKFAIWSYGVIQLSTYLGSRGLHYPGCPLPIFQSVFAWCFLAYEMDASSFLHLLQILKGRDCVVIVQFSVLFGSLVHSDVSNTGNWHSRAVWDNGSLRLHRVKSWLWFRKVSRYGNHNMKMSHDCSSKSLILWIGMANGTIWRYFHFTIWDGIIPLKFWST